MLGEGELMPNAWMATECGDSLPPQHRDEVCRRLAAVFVADHRDEPLGSSFPFAFVAPRASTTAATPAEVLDLSTRTRSALTATGVVEESALAGFTVTELGALPRVGSAMIAEIIAALIRRSTTADPTNSATVGEFDRITGMLNDRDLFLLTARIITRRRKTLAECGTTLGISRERVNQLDNRLRDKMHAAFHSAPHLRASADTLFAAARPVAALERMVEAEPDLDVALPAADGPLWFALSRLDDRFDIVDGWVVTPTMDAARNRSKSLLEQLSTDEGLVGLDAVAEALGIPQTDASAWLAYCGYRVIGEHVLAQSGSVHDNIAAILALSGKPMALNEIHASIVPARSLSSVRNAMVSDERFIRADRSRWALARWGTARYVPIHRQIGEILDTNGGKIGIEELVERLIGTFDVKEFSVRTYAASGEYVTTDGVVSRREKTYTPRKSPTKTRHLYREDAVLRWRTTIAPPHIKGSAFNLPSALAGLIGAGPKRSLELSSRLGPQSVVWVAVQARSGTIKRFVDDLGLAPGDEVFLEFALDSTTGAQFDVVAANPPPVDSAPIIRALVATGYRGAGSMDVDQARAALAEALWLPASSTKETIAETLRTRKEDELAALVEG
ncbi:hypothetical protein GCM10023318_33440 [Nocardia callitridis]|uniref:RNA polymerase sigma-70 region 4 domain-containing protein n=1 Tax=Nocardia callitridis TaxID=648753 RepID=A0ABP9KD45_9NOCA